jgi:hypothetical protein
MAPVSSLRRASRESCAGADDTIAVARACGVKGVHVEVMRFSPGLEKSKLVLDNGGGRDVRAEIHGTTGTIHADRARGEAGLLA